MCQSPAPASALEAEGPSEEEKAAQSKKEENEAKEADRVERAKAQEEAQKIKEAELEKELLVIRGTTMEYYKNSKIVDYLFASHNSGQSISPIVSGAVFHN